MEGDAEVTRRIKAAVDGLLFESSPSARAGSPSGGAVGRAERLVRAVDEAALHPLVRARLEADQRRTPDGDAGARGGERVSTARPWSREDFWGRLRTFRAATWFARPAPVSPPECARHGWANVGPDRLGCGSCGARCVMEAPPDLGAAREQAEQLVAGHAAKCAWREEACAASLAHFPPLPGKVLHDGFRGRVEDLMGATMGAGVLRVVLEAGELPDDVAEVAEEAARRVLLRADKMRQEDAGSFAGEGEGEEERPQAPEGELPGEPSADRVSARALGLLAVTGWEVRRDGTRSGSGSGSATGSASGTASKGPGAVLWCAVCGRSAGLWNFWDSDGPRESKRRRRTSVDARDEAGEFHPVHEHASYCPWVASHSAGTSRPATTSGWQNLSLALAARQGVTLAWASAGAAAAASPGAAAARSPCPTPAPAMDPVDVLVTVKKILHGVGAKRPPSHAIHARN